MAWPSWPWLNPRASRMRRSRGPKASTGPRGRRRVLSGVVPMALPNDEERLVAGGIVRASSTAAAGGLYTALDTLIH
jgi:hypothetical protein